jgi:hypothetical protein
MNSGASADQSPLLTFCIRGVTEPWEPLKRSANATAVLKMHNQSISTEFRTLDNGVLFFDHRSPNHH